MFCELLNYKRQTGILKTNYQGAKRTVFVHNMLYVHDEIINFVPSRGIRYNKIDITKP